ncbi:ABC transporter permease [Jeotgalibaca arthritidis]|uniref:Putative hemin transport system permease protein HrtB n=1 Tax=Jeotgalibaca arthritidis TaxID=1868794 RepID=A0A6G7K8Y0_9LACT|nr:ABC transporter permease [Jeotgalibaca arthritidis]QII81708.1 ABC transporter permease [Jeotgalibaca arthritidis]
MFLARKELWFSKRRFLLIGIIVVFITWLVFMLSGLGNGLSDLGTAVIRYSNMDVAIFQEDSEFALGKSILSQETVAQVEQVEGVDEAAGIITSAGAILLGDAKGDESGKKTSVMFVGIEPGSFLEPKVILGESLNSNNPNTILVDESLKLEGFSLGDSVILSGVGTEFEIGGFVQNQKLNHMPAVYAPLDTVQAFKYLVPGSNQGIDNPINAIFLKGSDKVENRISQQISGVEIANKKQTLNGVPGYKAESGTINLMLWLLILISAFIIAVFFYVLTNQKTHQFGVMKAIGASNGFVIRSVVSQVFLLVSISIVIGIGLTYLTEAFLPESMPFNLLDEMVVVYSFVILLTSLFGSLFSVRGIVKIDPVTALGRLE